MDLTGKIFQFLADELIPNASEDKRLAELSNKNLIIVHHLLPTHLPFFRYLIKTFHRVVLIAIPYSLDLNARNALLTESVSIESPPSLPELTNTLQRWILEFANSPRKFLIFEVGGYSCEILADNARILTAKLEGVVEDTEHGQRLHENQLLQGKMWWKLFTVARSPLKVAEDALTGDAVIYSLERQVRLLHHTLNLKNVLVIGFGKIGKYLSLSLKARKTNVFVYDTHPYKMVEAYSLGFEVRPREEMLNSADIIIGATGNTSIRAEDFGNLKDGVLLASASSKKVEFDLAYLQKHSDEANKINEWVDEYVLSSKRKVYLVNGGAPINFIDLGIIGLPLELVWLECLLCLLEVAAKSDFGIFQLEDDIRRKIAERWVHDVLMSGYGALSISKGLT